MASNHIEKRRRLFYAVLDVPKELREVMGRSRFRQSLGTDSQMVAERRAAWVVADWRKDIEAARGNPSTDDTAWHRRRLHKAGISGPSVTDIWLDELLNDPETAAARYRQAIRNAKTPERRQELIDQASDASYNIGYPPDADGQAFFTRALSHDFVAELDAWLAISRATARTQAMQRQVITDFSRSFPVVEDISRATVKRWVMARMAEGLSTATMRRHTSVLKTYWVHLQAVGVASDNLEPFSRLDIGRTTTKASSNGKSRTAFEPADVVRLLDAAQAKGDDALADLIDLARYTGCRREELASLRVDQVNLGEGFITVIDAKTKSGNRSIPIHSKLKSTIRRLVEASGADGFLLPGSTSKFGHRSNLLGKRFGALKAELGYPRQFVLHSIRATVATMLERAGVAEGVAADILGHRKRTLSYGLYSSGNSMDTMRAAIEKLSYPVG